MRFAVTGADPRFHALVVALDQKGTPMAQTWRAVGEAAWELGLPRPGYHMIRVLVRRVRTLREAKDDVRRAALQVLASFPSPYVAHLRNALGQLVEASAPSGLCWNNTSLREPPRPLRGPGRRRR